MCVCACYCTVLWTTLPSGLLLQMVLMVVLLLLIKLLVCNVLCCMARSLETMCAAVAAGASQHRCVMAMSRCGALVCFTAMPGGGCAGCHSRRCRYASLSACSGSNGHALRRVSELPCRHHR